MIIGNGIIAKAFSAFKENDEVLIFASGVSNSGNTELRHFDRERNLLLDTIKTYPEKRLVYFSTCSILDPTVNVSPYVSHKLAMEEIVSANAERFLIVRLANIVGHGGNEHTLINYLFNAVKHQNSIQLWELAERNVMDQEDMVYVVSEILKNETINQTLNVASSKNLNVVEMLQTIEKHLNKKAQYTLVEKGSPLPIDTAAIKKYLKKIEDKKGTGILYFETLLANYYTT